MTDEQIIKALELCAKDEPNTCDQCPYDKICAEDPDVITNDVISLIKNQKTIIQKLERIEELATKTIEVQNAEIERLEIECERYEVRVRDLNNYQTADRETRKRVIAKAKSEAIKEFAERLKNKFTHSGKSTKYGDFTWGDIKSYEIDNLLAEMTDNITKVEHNSLCETETYEGRGRHKNDIGQSD